MLDKLKRLFVVVDESSQPIQKEGTEAQMTEEQVTEKKQNTIPEIAIDKATPASQPDQKFIDMLLGAIDKSNIDGYDYLEYKQALQSLASMPMDDATKFNSALAMAKTMGASRENILKSASHYLLILDQEQAKFQQAVNAQQQRLEQSETNGLSTRQQSIDAKLKQIEQLQAQIEQEKAELASAEKEVQIATQKIQSTISQFKGAYEMVSKQIQNDVSLINQYTK